MIFDCACGFSIHSGDFVSWEGYQQCRDVHRERCTKSAGSSDVLSPRPGRQATGVEPNRPHAAPPVANQSCLAVRLWRLFRAWPIDVTDLRA